MDSRLIHVDGADLHVASYGEGPDVVVLAGGPGCVHYLERADLTVPGYRFHFPEPRGIGRSTGGPHTMARATADLEAIRTALGVSQWIVVGHSWGSDLGVRYAVDFPDAVTAVVGIAGRGPQRDATWIEHYEAHADAERATWAPIEWVREVHASLSDSFTEWTQSPTLWRSIADCPVPMRFVAAEHDIRPAWPVRQLAELLPHGSFEVLPEMVHNIWQFHPEVWRQTLESALGRTH